MKVIFDAKELKSYIGSELTIIHSEIQIDDSVIILCNSSEEFPAITLVMHVYVPNVDETFTKAINAGCEIIEQPKEIDGFLYRRATFKDFAGNMWSVGTQMNADDK